MSDDPLLMLRFAPSVVVPAGKVAVALTLMFTAWFASSAAVTSTEVTTPFVTVRMLVSLAAGR